MDCWLQMRHFYLYLRSSTSSDFATLRPQLTILSKTDSFDYYECLNDLAEKCLRPEDNGENVHRERAVAPQRYRKLCGRRSGAMPRRSWHARTPRFFTRDIFFFFSSRRRHTRLQGDWSSDVCSSD